MPPRRVPFRGLGLRQWLNLGLAALAAFYLLFGVAYFSFGSAGDHLSADFRSFRASAEIVLDRGFAEIYSLEEQYRVQSRLYDEINPSPVRVPFAPAPMYYLPVFVLPFLPFLLLRPVPSFYVWTALNAVILALYLWRFMRALYVRGDPWLIGRMMLCAPVLSTLYLGQINVWMLIFVGEFFLSSMQGKSFRSGLWLAGLLVKPQTLILVVPGLLLSRRFKILAGLVAAAAVIVGVSLLLVGAQGVDRLADLYCISWVGEPTTHADTMVNWRAVALNLTPSLTAELAWGIGIVGIVLTFGLGLALWQWVVDGDPVSLGLVLLGTFAATSVVTWHSHIHMTMSMIPLLLFLHLRRRLSWQLLYAWLYIPALLFTLGVVAVSDFADTISVLGMLAVNLYLVLWAARALWRPRRAERAAALAAGAKSRPVQPAGNPRSGAEGRERAGTKVE